MYRYIGDQLAYDLFNYIGFVALMISSLFYFKLKQKTIGLHSKRIIYYASHTNIYLGRIVEFVLASLESLLMAYLANLASYVNKPFGDLVGTGANYFGLLFLVPLAWFVVSTILMINPLKQIDIATLYLPTYLAFVKFACFCQGCCWGISWEYGPYNRHPYHPGNQVPVQAIEIFFALTIFIFLLFYRKKAKQGTIFPMYMILYSATRFPVEFLSAAHEKVLGPFNTYHFLCIAGIIIGLAMLLIVKRFGEKIAETYEKPHEKFALKMAQKEEQKALNLAEEKAKAEADEVVRKEKVRLARERAKARKK